MLLLRMLKMNRFESIILMFRKGTNKNRFPCDTISLKEYVLSNYDKGTYLVQFDRTFTFNVPKEAVVYFKDGGNFILARDC